MIELIAVTLNALHSAPRPVTCPRAKVWMRRHGHSIREAAVPEIAEMVLDIFNSPMSAFLAFLVAAIVVKYVTIFQKK
jgi:hypothetical protein